MTGESESVGLLLGRHQVFLSHCQKGQVKIKKGGRENRLSDQL